MALVLHQSHKRQRRQDDLSLLQLLLLCESAKRMWDLWQDRYAEFLQRLREISAGLVQYKHRPFRRYRSLPQVGSDRPKSDSSRFGRS